MKKFTFTIVFGLGVLFWVMPTLTSANVLLSPSNIDTAPGEVFNIIISIDPQGIKNYTAKTELEYSADLLEVKSFNFGSNWMVLFQEGYDLIDNEQGLLIKSAGYPGGLSSTAIFGTVSFLSKKAGSGTIAIGDNSFVLDSTNQNVIGDKSSRTSVAVVAPVYVEPEVIVAPKVEGEIEISVEESGEVTTEEVVTTEEESASREEESLLATIGRIMTFENETFRIIFFFLIAILAVLVYYFVQKTYRKRL